MTLWASRDGQKVTIHGNTGLDVQIQDSRVSGFTITEDAQYIKHLWGTLGKLIEDAEAETRPAAVHEAEPGGF